MAFAVVAPFPELANLIQKACTQLDFQIRVEVGDLEEGVRAAERLIKEDKSIEVLVSRGGTAKLIESRLGIPTVAIEIGTFDIIRALAEAAHYGKNIGVIGFKNIIFGSSQLGDYLGIKITELEYSHKSELEILFEVAVEVGLDAVVGDNASSKVSEAAGIKTIRMESGIEAIINALRKANEMAVIRRNEKIKAEELRAIVGTTHEGIITADKSGKIILVNNAAEKMFKQNRSQMLNQPVKMFASYESVQKALQKGEKTVGEVVKYDDVLLVQNISPVIIDREVQGLVISMNDSEYVESVETKVRKELYLKGHVAQYQFSDIATKSELMENVIQKAVHYAKTDLTVLIIGESGTGKEMIAQSIHQASERKKGPFIAVNVAVMQESLLESELFGYEQGAFTGAKKGGKKGLFELAHNGTLFLDEIGEMSLGLQSRLLRVLQEKSIMKVGGDKVISINTRVIAATHVDLSKAVEEGSFRRDLYYRLNVLSIAVPSINDRREDIPLLLSILNERVSRELGVMPPVYSEEVMVHLTAVDWKGNVRQIENMVSRIAVLYGGRVVSVEEMAEVMDHMPDQPIAPGWEVTLKLDDMKKMEMEIIDKALKLLRGDKEKVQKMLGISRTTLWRKLNH